MQPADTEELGSGITCIDAHYIRPGLACFYLLREGDEYAVIETGTVHSVPVLETVLAQRAIEPAQVRYIIPTHVHLDHAGGAGAMMRLFPEARCLAHPRGARHLVEPGKLVAGSRAVYGDERYARLYGEVVPVDADRLDEADDGHIVALGERRLVLRHTPGHADHHFCVWDERSRGWFTGDVFGISYSWFRTPGGDFAMPSTTPSQFRPEALRESLALLHAYDPAVMYLTHYSALPYSGELRELLVGQIDAYLDITRESGGDAEAVEAKIVDHSLALVRRLNPGQSMDALRAEFIHDAHLNAQGLELWHARNVA